MDFNTDANRKELIKYFPSLAQDGNFEIKSECTPIYNCIAWAMGLDNVWVDFLHIAGHWWPEGVGKNDSCQSLVDAFKAVGFEDADNLDEEAGYEKVVLYEKNGHWTHAARCIAPNVEHSKFGEGWDGTHSHDIFNNSSYGIPFAFMKRKASVKPVVPLKGRIVVNKNIFIG